MIGNMVGLLPSQPRGFRNQPPIGLFTFWSILPANILLLWPTASRASIFPTTLFSNEVCFKLSPPLAHPHSPSLLHRNPRRR